MWLFLAVPWVCLQFVIVVFPDHTHLLFCIDVSVLSYENKNNSIIACFIHFVTLPYNGLQKWCEIVLFY